MIPVIRLVNLRNKDYFSGILGNFADDDSSAKRMMFRLPEELRSVD